MSISLIRIFRKAGFLASFLFMAASFWSSTASALNLTEYPKLQAVADQLIAGNYYSQAELEALFAQINLQPSVLEAMQNPAEYKFTWGKYRKLFLQDDRIQRGVEFWQQHALDLQRAEKEFGVPASIIVAIIGVESKFGEYKGKYKVLDSLSTLVVGFERRSEFFARELKEFLILTKENRLAALDILGSYAGAVGFPQFISSSYRSYAIDFSGDGSVDLIDQPIDAIGSIANYFLENGWLPGEPVTSTAHTSVVTQVAELANRKRNVEHTAQYLRSLGAPLPDTISDTEKLNVLMLDANEITNEDAPQGFYLVRAGDTACEIAELHNVPCKSLFKINKLNEKGAIFRGQRLTIPVRPEGPSAPSNTSSHKPSGKWQLAADKVDSSKPLYFFTHKNFYVITRYNQSVLYAMAVFDLSQAIAAARQASTSLTEARL